MRGFGQGGQRMLGPDGNPDDNYIPMHPDLGCRMNPTCLDCPLLKCIEDFQGEGHGGQWSTRAAITYQYENGGILTPFMLAKYNPVPLGVRGDLKEAA